jgi:hypothetical protein
VARLRRDAMPIEPFVSLPLLALPAWVWASLLMAGFVAVSVLTMALARIAVRERPTPKGSSAGKDDPAEPPGRPSR